MRLGRVPGFGKASEWPSPGGPKSLPYGLTTAGNIVWYSETGTNPPTIVRFDTKTEKFQTWVSPSGGGEVHHMIPTPDGNVWAVWSDVNGAVIAMIEVKSGSR